MVVDDRVTNNSNSNNKESKRTVAFLQRRDLGIPNARSGFPIKHDVIADWLIHEACLSETKDDQERWKHLWKHLNQAVFSGQVAVSPFADATVAHLC